MNNPPRHPPALGAIVGCSASKGVVGGYILAVEGAEQHDGLWDERLCILVHDLGLITDIKVTRSKP